MPWSNIYLSTADKSNVIDYILSRKKSEIENIFYSDDLFYSRSNQKNNFGVLITFKTATDKTPDRKQLFYLEEIAKAACVEATHTYTPMYTHHQLDNLGPKQAKRLHIVTQERNHVDATFNSPENIDKYYALARACSQLSSTMLGHELDNKLSRKSIMPSIISTAAHIFSQKAKSLKKNELVNEFYTSIKNDIPSNLVAELETCFEEQYQQLEKNRVSILCPMNQFTPQEEEILRYIDNIFSNLTSIEYHSKLFVFLLHSLFNNFGLSIAEEIYLTYLVKSSISAKEIA